MTRRILTAREQHQMLAPWRQAAADDQWMQDYQKRLRQDRLDRQQNATKIYRGLRTDLPPELEAHIKEHYRKDVPFDLDEIGGHLAIGPKLLDHLQSAHPRLLNHGDGYGHDDDDKLGLGRHWTTNRQFAEKAAMQGGKGRHGIILEADRPGPEHRDLNHTGVGGSRADGRTPWQEEEEDTLLPGAPLNVTSVHLNGKEVLHDPKLEKRMPANYGLPYPGGPRQHTAARLAAVTRDLVDHLEDQFYDWWDQNGNPDEADHGGPGRGPIGHWPHVENFLRDTYPAAHKNLEMGMEEAGALLDGHPPQYMIDNGLGKAFRPPAATPYETGPEAVARHGYDPAEVAASMVLLHNDSHPHRGQEIAEQDTRRLVDIFKKRMRMQRDYERRLTTAATDPSRPMGININDTHQDYTGQILRGEKTIETRDTRSLNPYVGRRIALFRTHDSKRVPTLVVGHATVGEPVHYPDVESFDADYDRHLVGSDSPHHFTRAKYGEKYGYPMLDPVALDRPMLVNSTGNVARGAEETDFAPYDGPWPLHTAGGVFNPHLDWDEPDVSAAVHAYLHPDEVMGYARHDNEWRNLGNMDKLMGHLSEHGMLEPIYIGAGPEHAVIEDGHHRALAAQALGWGKVPVHITNDPHLGDEYETPHGPGLRVYLNGDRR